MIKLDVNNGVVHNGHVDLPRRMRSSFQLPGTVSGQTAFDKFVRLASLCRGEEAENRNVQGIEETEEGEDSMSDEQGDIFDRIPKLTRRCGVKVRRDCASQSYKASQDAIVKKQAILAEIEEEEQDVIRIDDVTAVREASEQKFKLST